MQSLKKELSIVSKKNKSGGGEKGVSLYVAFMIMSILLVIGFSISAILVSEIKVMRGMGRSVSAFYAAETGIEKTLYLDNTQIPEGGDRGLCNICNIPEEWDSCQLSGSDCDPISCTNCICTFYDETKGLRHDVEAAVTPVGETSTTIIKSVGTYKGTKRAIQIKEEPKL